MLRALTRQEADLYAASKLVGQSLGKEFAKRCLESFSEIYRKFDIETEYAVIYKKDKDTYTYIDSSNYLLFSYNEFWTQIQIYAPDAVIKSVAISGGHYGGHYINGYRDKFSETEINDLCNVVLT